MARVTVEDCLENVKNRFELVIISAKRARQLMRGSAEPKVAWENDKATVVALREIAMGYTDFSDAHHADNVPVHVVSEAAIIEADDVDMTDEGDDRLDVTAEESAEQTIAEDFEVSTPEDTTEDDDNTGNNTSNDDSSDDQAHAASITGTHSESE